MMRTTGLAIRLPLVLGGCAPGRLPASAEIFPFREGKRQDQKRTERKIAIIMVSGFKGEDAE